MKRTLVVLADRAFGLTGPLPPEDDFQAQLLEAALKDSLALFQRLDFGPGWALPDLVLLYLGDRSWYAARAGASWLLVPQMGLTLSQWLDNLLIVRAMGPEDETLIVGPRTPCLSLRDLQRAFLALHQHGTCLGPTDAGGVYALGIRGRWPTGTLGKVRWHEQQAARDVQRALRGVRLGVAMLEKALVLGRREDLLKLLADVPACDPNSFPFLKSMARKAGLAPS